LYDTEYEIEDVYFRTDPFGEPLFIVLIKPKEPINGVISFALRIPAKDYSLDSFRRVVNDAVQKEIQRIKERNLKEKLARMHMQELKDRYEPIVQRLVQRLKIKVGGE